MLEHANQICRGGTVLDLACGSGRNARWLAEQAWQVVAVDRNEAAIDALNQLPNIDAAVADLENGPWPYPGRQFDGIVVCRYLHRALFPILIESLADNGVLIFETFMVGQEKLGRPQNSDFLLQPGELLEACEGTLQVIAFEQGLMSEPKPAMLQRICAKRSLSTGKT